MTTSRKLLFILLFGATLPVFIVGLVLSAVRWAYIAGSNTATELLLDRPGAGKK